MTIRRATVHGTVTAACGPNCPIGYLLNLTNNLSTNIEPKMIGISLKTVCYCHHTEGLIPSANSEPNSEPRA